MTTNETTLTAFINAVVTNGKLWVLNVEDEYVVVDSIEFENTDVMPLFSSEEKASAMCVDEWAAYQAVSLDIEDFFESWLPSLDEDNVLLSLDLSDKLVGDEIEAFVFAKQLADKEV